MPYVIIENFSGGLDLRRLPAVSTPGSLLELTNAHITRGGEIEKRKAFATSSSLPSGTHGLAADDEELWVFGSAPNPSMPSGINYQRLQHPDGHSMVRVHSWDLYGGRFYVAAEFSNGDILHFYDGERVENWFDGKARGGFTVAESSDKSGTRSSVGLFLFHDSRDLDVRVFANNPDDPNEPLNLTGGVVSILETDSVITYSEKIRDAVNANSSETGISAQTFIIGGARIEFYPTDTLENFDGRTLWFRIQEPGVFTIDPQADPISSICTGSGSCSNNFTLQPNVNAGYSPFSFLWEIVDTGGTNVTLSNETAENPTLTVSAPTPDVDCQTRWVTIKLTVTDDETNELNKTFSVASIHCSPNISSARSMDPSLGFPEQQ